MRAGGVTPMVTIGPSGGDGDAAQGYGVREPCTLDKLLNSYLPKNYSPSTAPGWRRPNLTRWRGRVPLLPVQVVSTLMIHTASGGAMEADIRIIVAALIGSVDTHTVLVADSR
jgi:hypothetical protein